MGPSRTPLPSLEEEKFGRAFDRRLLGRLLRYSLPYRRFMALVVVLILVTTLINLVGPFIVKWVIDGPLRAAISGEEGGSGVISDAALELYGAAALYLFAAALFLFLRYLQSISMATIGQRVMRDLRIELFHHLQRLPVAYFDRNPVGRLTTRVSNDIEALNQLFSSGVVNFIADLLVLLGISAALIWVNLELAMTTLLVLPPLVGVTILFRRTAQRAYRDTRRHLSHLNAFTQESIQGMRIIQLFVRERENAGRFCEINGEYRNAFQRTVLCYSLYFPAVEVIAALALGAILWRSGAGIRAGALSFGEFYLFWHFLGRFIAPIRDMADRYNVLQSAMAAAERIFKVLDEPARDGPVLAETREEGLDSREEGLETREEGFELAASRASESTPAIPARLRGEVEFRDVWFGYEKNESDINYAVRGVNFTVHPGETLAIVGATGAGKSTLVNLLARFYEPQRGRILVDGRDLAEYPLREFRRKIGLVLQDPFLFSRTIRENIRLGRMEVSDEVVSAAARRMNAERFLSRLPGGLDEMLGERGAGLSAGEKQLLSFTRALVHDPDILILDEATAHIDPATEALIREALRELISGRTSIVIAHRLSTIREANRIAVLHKGELRELGAHRELLQKRGIYYRLYRLQLEPDLPRSDDEAEREKAPPWPEDELAVKEGDDEPSSIWS